MAEEIDVARALLGAGLFFLPGLTWSWAFLRSVPIAYRWPLALLLGFTIGPAASYLLHMALGVPLSLEVTVFLYAALGATGLAVLARADTRRWSLESAGARHESPVR